VSGSDTSWFTHVPTGASVTLGNGYLKASFLTYERTKFLEGEAALAMDNRPAPQIDTALFANEVETAWPPKRRKR
jgi:hypothetical protein